MPQVIADLICSLNDFMSEHVGMDYGIYIEPRGVIGEDDKQQVRLEIPEGTFDDLTDRTEFVAALTEEINQALGHGTWTMKFGGD